MCIFAKIIDIFSHGSKIRWASIGSDNGLAQNSRQAIIWLNDDPFHRCMFAPFGLNEFELYQSIAVWWLLCFGENWWGFKGTKLYFTMLEWVISRICNWKWRTTQKKCVHHMTDMRNDLSKVDILWFYKIALITGNPICKWSVLYLTIVEPHDDVMAWKRFPL